MFFDLLFLGCENLFFWGQKRSILGGVKKGSFLTLFGVFGVFGVFRGFWCFSVFFDVFWFFIVF
jgi:hypothetical protein